VTSESTVLISLAGSAFVATIPKLIDIFFGTRISRKKEEADREAAYRLKVFEDAAATRQENAVMRAELLAERDRLERRVRELEGNMDSGVGGGAVSTRRRGGSGSGSDGRGESGGDNSNNKGIRES